MSSFIERMKERMTGSLTPRTDPKKVEKVRQIVKTNRWDNRAWKAARDSETIDNLVTDLELGDKHKGGERDGFDASPELTEGIWQTLYKAAPLLEDKKNLDKDLHLARKVCEEMKDHPRLADLQEFTAGDPVTTTLAVDAMSEEIRQIISRVTPPQPPDDEPGDEEDDRPGGCGGLTGKPGDDGEPGEGPGQGPGTAPDEEGDGDGEGEGEGGVGGDTPDFDAEAEDAEAQAEAEWEEALDNALDEIDFDRLLNKALDKAHDDAEELDNTRKGIGCEDGDWQQMSPEERLAMAERLNTPMMKELSKVIGQMKRFALGVKATKINDVPHEIFDVTTGDNIRDILRPQLALLGTPETTYEFYRRMADKELLVYKKRGTEEVGKGPVVIAIDKSGSMGGAPFNWAMGVAEALRRFAADEERDYYAMFFGSNNDRNRFDFPKGKGPFQKVLAFLSVVANGGTQFDGVLTEALEKASKMFDEHGAGKADIVFLTDGQAHLSPEWIAAFNKERERVGVRVYSVFIGGGYDMRYSAAPIALLEQISDVVIPVSELKPESVKEIFANV